MAEPTTYELWSDSQALNVQTLNDDSEAQSSYKLKWHRVKQLTYGLTTIVVLITLVKGAFRLYWYGNTGTLCTVPENATAIRTNENAYIVTIVIMYLLEAALRILQYIVLAKGICTLASKEILSVQDPTTSLRESWQAIKKALLRCRNILGVILVLLLLFPTTAVPIVSIILDTKRIQRVECSSAALPLIITYQVLSLLSYIAAIGPRLLMALATITICEIWTCNPPNVNEGAECAEHSLSFRDAENADHTFRTFLDNWDTSTAEFSKLFTEYTVRGEKVISITKVFQTWFILPWIIYFLAVSIETQIKPDRSEAPSLLAVFYYLLYHSTEFFSLFVPYICGKLINSYHNGFYRKLRELQLRAVNCNRQALGCMMHFERDEHYSFVPLVFLTSIKIRMSNPLYVIFLLLGLLFAVYDKFL